MTDTLAAEWSRVSWVESANEPGCGFPLQSLPYCAFASGGATRLGVGIGALVLDLEHCCRAGLLKGASTSVLAACRADTLNLLMACAPEEVAALRRRLMELLDAQASATTRTALGAALYPVAEVTLLKPVEPLNYTDFYASIHHATRVGKLFRPENPLLPNYKYVPIGYHGRASSIVISGTPVRRPWGQTRPVVGDAPGFGAAQFLDYEVEVGMYVAGANELGESVPIAQAKGRIFGFCLLNDWSARDLQVWENQPLGPFLSKSFATSVSPWVVPVEALAPFRVAAARRAKDDPPPLSYLSDANDQSAGAIDMTVEAWLSTENMRRAGASPQRLSRANLRDLFWTPAQLIAHHASNGCNLLPGDLLATGTVSGESDDSAGCLLELTANRTKPFQLENRESRTALEDGDEVVLRGFCKRPGFPDVFLGECRGLVLPAKQLDFRLLSN
jgi:fumarylacetoacetase